MIYLIIILAIVVCLIILALIDKFANTTIDVIRPIDKLDKNVKEKIDNASIEEMRDILNELNRRDL
mgnify:CR=1 FL=1